MWKYWLFQLLFQAVVNVALPLPIVSSTTTSFYDLSPLPVLTPPANLSECVQSNYCNNGTCVLIRDPGPRVSCACHQLFVDSEAGLCTIKGKSRRTAFITRCFLIFHLLTCTLNVAACLLERLVLTGSTWATAPLSTSRSARFVFRFFASFQEI